MLQYLPSRLEFWMWYISVWAVLERWTTDQFQHVSPLTSFPQPTGNRSDGRFTSGCSVPPKLRGMCFKTMSVFVYEWGVGVLGGIVWGPPANTQAVCVMLEGDRAPVNEAWCNLSEMLPCLSFFPIVVWFPHYEWQLFFFFLTGFWEERSSPCLTSFFFLTPRLYSRCSNLIGCTKLSASTWKGTKHAAPFKKPEKGRVEGKKITPATEERAASI